MKLFSIQPIDVWEKLQQEQVLLADPLLGGYIEPKPGDHTLEEDTFYIAYDWMRQQMAKRIPDYQGNWPWWAWHTWYTQNDKPCHSPDLRRERFNYNLGEDWVRLHLEIPDEKVLLSCFDGWRSVLNHWFLCHTEEEDDALEAEWNSIRHGNPKISLVELRAMLKKGIEPPPLTPEQQAKMDDFDRRRKESWEKAFDLDWMRSSPLWEGATAIQACFEELRLDQVKKVTHFKGARKPRS
jgi:hypothetical protein